MLKDLNTEQLQAVKHETGPLLIVAGAGTGKTTAITKKLAYLILEKKVKPENILALTFTEKAAAEMEERVDKLMPYGYTDLWIETFHGFCDRILKDNALDVGLDPNYKLLTSAEQWMFIKSKIFDFDLKYYRPLGNPNSFISELIKHFSRAKDENILPEDYLKFVKKLSASAPAGASADKETIDKMSEVAKSYKKYQELMVAESQMDFGDLIIETLKLFKKRKNILKKYQKQFQYILVDEFQDTNFAQYQLLQLLAPPQNNLTVVGDDDQCLPPDSKIETKTGIKKINKIKKGELVLSAVGKGHTSYYQVNKVIKNKKNARFLNISTKNGNKITITDNHKMFCFVPLKSDKKYYYVYLMEKRNLGYRLGITNDLATRLRLERGADRIIGIKSFKSEIEARYYETLLSLKYQIPLTCFCFRPGVFMNKELLEKLYQEFDTYKNAERLAKDLKIDLSAHHFALDAVNRGSSLRIKIIIEQCYRKHVSKVRRGILFGPKISHSVIVETSDKKTIETLKKNGFNLRKARKNGFRFKYTDQDFQKVGQIALKLEKITGGILETRFEVGALNIKHRKALMMPAKNLLVGHFLPVLKKDNKEIIYDEIIDIKEKNKTSNVYDLEIEKTHNFIADNIVVHNSIYKFRGASVSNILQFQKDFPKSKKIVLTENYRSVQPILDLAYNSIQLNNPDRLEAKYKINKKLKSQIKSKSDLAINHIHKATYEQEAVDVIKNIINLKQKDKSTWSDFAILVRANSSAEIFINLLSSKKIPYQFIASRGLYSRPEIMDLISYLRVVANFYDNINFYRVLSLPIFKLNSEDIIRLVAYSRRKNLSIFDLACTPSRIVGLNKDSVEKFKVVVELVKKHAKLSLEKNAAEVLLDFLKTSGYLKYLQTNKDLEAEKKILNISLFFKRIQELQENKKLTVPEFIDQLDLMIEAGEDPSPIQLDEGPDSIKILTIHSSKGLEFDNVFVVNMVEGKFPSRNRKDLIELPEKLIKEQLPDSNSNIQEERRLFYVAMTRAKKRLFFTSANDYGGKRKKKISRFLVEIKKHFDKNSAFSALDSACFRDNNILTQNNAEPNAENAKKKIRYSLPSKFSYTQLKAFETCPHQYRFRHIIGLPSSGASSQSYGKTMHAVLQNFFADLQKGKSPTEKDLLSYYDSFWIDDFYQDKKHEQKRFEEGKKALQEFYKINNKNLKAPLFLEKGFNLRIKDTCLKGQIDRIDKLDDGTVEIVDYKTGKLPKNEKEVEKNEQLLIYSYACQKVLNLKPSKLSLYFIDQNKKYSAKQNSIKEEKIIQKVQELIAKIKESEFIAKPGFACKFCDYKDICEHAKH
ncbi:MAG: UvrD-helicase domain-containing protein [Patescibacteria group bacterium]|jgi:DNA helicase-2/ATP-dependent DNA helicase PcrA